MRDPQGNYFSRKFRRYNNRVATLGFWEARNCVLEHVPAAMPAVETISTLDADGRVLAADLAADRDYPPVARSVRDGFAVRAGDAPQGLRVVGEVRAGETYQGVVGFEQAVEIMTGAPVPAGADAVVMIEHVQRHGDVIRTDRAVHSGDFINPGGSEARRGDIVVPRGARLDYARIAMAASVGRSSVSVYRKPVVKIISTGDEVVPVDAVPADYQVRNSNAWSVAVQVRRAGGEPHILPVAGDTYEATRAAIESALDADLLLLSGGVSAGKYDVVERVLADFHTEFYFDRVRIQPGQPVVFGHCGTMPVFGLPGNPGSTMVTFELFARPALERLSGVAGPPLPFTFARLRQPFRHRTGLMRFLPAMLSSESAEVTPIASKGSSDVPALARANVFLVADEDRESWAEGDWMRVLPK